MKSFKMLLVAVENLYSVLCILVTRLGRTLKALNLLFNRLDVLHLQLKLDVLKVPDGVDGTVYMRLVVIIKASQHMYQGISVSYLTEKPVPGALALSLHKPGDINDINSGVHDAVSGLALLKLVQTLVRHLNDAKIGPGTCAVRVGLPSCVGDTVENSSLAYTRYPYNAAFQCHLSCGSVSANVPKSGIQDKETPVRTPLFAKFSIMIKP